ncbi:hypothetical protein AB0J20_16420 [Micromonospora costi]|uniref:hypothetical protein n=1 Tax=Micromonospora costi TaxID=1530042 RepID=UPI0033D12F04
MNKPAAKCPSRYASNIGPTAAATAWWGEPGPARPTALLSALRKLTGGGDA